MSFSPGPLLFPQVHSGLSSNDRQPLSTDRKAVLFQAKRGNKRFSVTWEPANKTAPLSRAGAHSPHAGVPRGAGAPAGRGAAPRVRQAPPGAPGSRERRSPTSPVPALSPAARRPARGLLTPRRAPRAPEQPRAPSSSRPATSPRAAPGHLHLLLLSPRGPRRAPPPPAAAHLRTRAAQPPPQSSTDKCLALPARSPSSRW